MIEIYTCPACDEAFVAPWYPDHHNVCKAKPHRDCYHCGTVPCGPYAIGSVDTDAPV